MLERRGVSRTRRRIQQLRDQLDALIAGSCPMCDGTANAIGRPFILDRRLRRNGRSSFSLQSLDQHAFHLACSIVKIDLFELIER